MTCCNATFTNSRQDSLSFIFASRNHADGGLLSPSSSSPSAPSPLPLPDLALEIKAGTAGQRGRPRRRRKRSSSSSSDVVSTLSIDNVVGGHSGNYTCAPSNARAASIMVHVVDGE